MFFIKANKPQFDISKFYLKNYSQLELIQALLSDGYKPSWAGEIHYNIKKRECQSSWFNVKSLFGYPHYRLAKLTIEGIVRESHGNAMGTYLLLVELEWKIFDLVRRNKPIPKALTQLAYSPESIMILAIPMSLMIERKVAGTNAYIHTLLGYLPSGKMTHAFSQIKSKPINKAYSILRKNRPEIKFGIDALKVSMIKTRDI